MKDKVYIALSNMGLISESYWGCLKDRQVDLNKWQHICYIASMGGANLFRTLPFGVWEIPNISKMLTPFVLRSDGKFDLSQLDDQYFLVVEYIITTAKRWNIRCLFDLFDRCQLSIADMSPYRNNVNGVNDHAKPNCDAFNNAYLDRIIPILKAHGCLFGMGNEMLEDTARMVEYVIMPALKRHNVSVEDMAYPTSYWEHHDFHRECRRIAQRVFGRDEAERIFFRVHNVLHKDVIQNQEKDALEEFGNRRMIVSDDGTFGGLSPCDVYYYEGREQRRPSAEAWNIFTKYVLNLYYKEEKQFIFEHLPKHLDMEGCQLPTMQAISEGYKEYFGEYPENYGNEPDNGGEEEEEEGEQPEPDAPKKFKWWVLVIAFIVCMIIILCTLFC